MSKQENKKFLIILVASLIAYFILDYVLNNFMLFVMSGLVGGSIKEVFKSFGSNVGMVPVVLIWTAFLIGVVFLYYRLNNNLLKYSLLVVIAALLYVVDTVIAGIPISETADIQKMRLMSNLLIGAAILSKSLILSFIVFAEKSKQQ